MTGNKPLSQFVTDLENGLSSEEVQRRIGEYGYNEIPERTISPISKFAKKFWGITPWILETTIFLEWLIGKYLEVYIITALLIFSAIISFIQEEKANAALSLAKVGTFLGISMVAESLFILYIGLSYFGLFNNTDQLHTFVFVWLTFSGYFIVMTVRERKHFWESKPSKPLSLAIMINSIIVILVSILGVPEIVPIPPWQS